MVIEDLLATDREMIQAASDRCDAWRGARSWAPGQGIQAECRATDALKKILPTYGGNPREAAHPAPLEVWFQDEIRVGQKNKLSYR
jgi:hypothetical protein